jgi:hypothetical protein
VTPLCLDLTAEKDLARALALHHAPAISAAKESKSTARSPKKTRKGRDAVR